MLKTRELYMKPVEKVVLFDLGKTLLYPLNQWPEVFSIADRALVHSLSENGISSDLPISSDEFQTCLNQYYESRNIDLVELTAETILKEFLLTKGFNNVPGFILREALNAMYAVTQSNWVIEDDAHSVLQTLSIEGYKMGLISNAADDQDVQQLIDTWDLRKYFNFILTSATSGRRKPHPLMFQKALEYFKIQPSQTVMVGDTLEADLAGAQSLGIYGIWINRRAQLPPDGELEVQPQAIISKLSELPDLLSDIYRNP